MTHLDRTAIPGNVLDRLEEVERRLDDLVGYAAMPTIDPGSGEGETTYVEILKDIQEGPDIVVTASGTDVTVGRAGESILLFGPGAVLREYVFTEAGLIAALAAASAGDVVRLYAGTIMLSVNPAYTPGAELDTGAITVTSEAGHEITPLTPGTWYCVESYNGYFSLGPGWAQVCSDLALSDGGGFSGNFGQGVEGDQITPVDRTGKPTWAAFAEAYTEVGDGKRYGRAFFQAPGVSIWVHAFDGPGDYADNTGTLSWRLREATFDPGLVTNPVDVEIVGLGEHSVLDGMLVNNGILTNLQVTGEISGTGTSRLVSNPTAQLFSRQIASTLAAGTAPLSVVSPTVNGNLNADLLDGQHGEAYLSDADFAADEGFMRKTGAGAYEAIKSNLAAAVDPTINEDSGDGYAVGSIWINTTDDKEFTCLDSTVGAAVWLELGGGVSDAADVTYTPAVDADWAGDADPGNANDAFDQLAERTTDIEDLVAGVIGATWNMDGALAVAVDVGEQWVMPEACTIVEVIVSVKENGSANSTIVDVNKNGVTLFTTQGNRPTIAHDDADNYDIGVPDITGIAQYDEITLDIDAIATGATDLRVILVIEGIGGAGGGGGGDSNATVCNGRLTLTTGVPVTTANVSAATTLYFTPYKGDLIGLYDGASAWTVYEFAEKSLDISGYTADKNYDIFVYDNAGTPALEGLVWTDDTTRATVLATQDGVYVKTGATTRRYLGTIRITDQTGECEDSLLKRFVWNYYNQQRRKLFVEDATDSWTYTTAAYRQANNNAANKVQYVCGVVLGYLSAQTFVYFTSSTTARRVVITGIGLDRTNASDSTLGGRGEVNSAIVAHTQTFYTGAELIGYHYLAWLEYSNTETGTTTWYGTHDAAMIFSGFLAWMQG